MKTFALSNRKMVFKFKKHLFHVYEVCLTDLFSHYVAFFEFPVHYLGAKFRHLN